MQGLCDTHVNMGGNLIYRKNAAVSGTWSDRVQVRNLTTNQSFYTSHDHHGEAHGRDGGWQLDHGMVTFKDGHTATLGEAYFELGKPGSSISLYSAAQPAADAAKAKPATAVIDWSAANAKQADADDARKKTAQPGNWLSSFLGVDNCDK